ncbi:hypothetical protein EYF80_014449 [Liparis tanakae]|uniref:Uncharacterized protein n=1 Tax=Liparis tanakae TaxID=230148 RepID=A0A4Z2IDL6_9TELE|nr:hypothetical protein EYF80_014449 [Liparis tanakae]
MGCEKTDAELPSCGMEGSDGKDSHGNKTPVFAAYNLKIVIASVANNNTRFMLPTSLALPRWR